MTNIPHTLKEGESKVLIDSIEKVKLRMALKKETDDKVYAEEAFKEAVKSEISISTQRVPKGSKEQLVAYWKSISTLSAFNVLSPEQIKEIVIRFSFAEPSAFEIQNKILLAQVSLMGMFHKPQQPPQQQLKPIVAVQTKSIVKGSYEFKKEYTKKSIDNYV